MVALLSGCAWTKTPVNIVLTPGLTEPLKEPAKTAVRVGDVKDERVISDPRAVTQKYNAYGKTTGAYLAQKPVTELFREAIETALKTNAFKVAASGTAYELKAQIQDYEGDHIQTGAFSAKIILKLTVRFELEDTASGNSVWRDTLIGKAEDKSTSGSVAFVERTFKATVEDVLRQLVADKAFRKFLQ